MTFQLRILAATFFWLMFLGGMSAWGNGRGDLALPLILGIVALAFTPKRRPVHL